MEVRAKDLGNVPRNLIAPVAGTRPIIGAAQYVLLECVVEKIIRKAAKATDYRWRDLFVIHSLSLPFIGGFGKILSPAPVAVESAMYDQLQDGLGGSIAVFYAQYISETMSKGFYVPRPTVRDVLITVLAKVVTRPLLALISRFMPAELRNGVVALNRVFGLQKERSLAPVLLQPSRGDYPQYFSSGEGLRRRGGALSAPATLGSDPVSGKGV